MVSEGVLNRYHVKCIARGPLHIWKETIALSWCTDRWIIRVRVWWRSSDKVEVIVKLKGQFHQWMKRIWAGDHTDAPVARTGGLLQAEEDHGCQLREGQHESAQVTADADVIICTHFLNDVISLLQAVLLTLPWPCWGNAPQRHRTLLARHGNPAEIWKTAWVDSGVRGMKWLSHCQTQ